jgi:cysteine desulfurase family protein
MIYLDNAATSWPKPPTVVEGLRGWLDACVGSPGRGGHGPARAAEAMVRRARQAIAALLHAPDPDRVIFTLNATDALNMAIKGLVRPGDHVVTTVLEHNSVSRPLAGMERRGLIQVTRLRPAADGRIDPARVREALTDRTSLVAVIHGSNVTGALQPIGDIGHLTRARGARLLVDASQTAGAVPIDVQAEAVDLLAFAGHKTLLGLPGTGGLVVGPRAELSPWREGGTGVLSELLLQPTELPWRLEAGSPNTLGAASLVASVAWILQRGVEATRRHELALVERLIDRLAGDARLQVHGPTDLTRRTSVVSVSVRGAAPARVARFLDEAHGIAVRAGLHCAPGAHQTIGTFPTGTVRVSPGPFTTEADIDACATALREAAEADLPAAASCAEHT